MRASATALCIFACARLLWRHGNHFVLAFEGLLQTDGYSGYDQIGGPKMVHAACWSHAERYFSDAVQLNPKDALATANLTQIDELFAIDAEARRHAFSTAARAAPLRFSSESHPAAVAIVPDAEHSRI